MPELCSISDTAITQALVSVLGESKWAAVAVARGYLAVHQGASEEVAARLVFENGPQTLKRSRELVSGAKDTEFLSLLDRREKKGSAENPITKLFPARITEDRFAERLDELIDQRDGLDYRDDRGAGYTHLDFTVADGDLELPLNVKNAGTRYEKAAEHVGIDPDDCLPIPAYKAHGALEQVPNLLYTISQDYELLGQLDTLLPGLFDEQEAIVWELLNDYGAGGGLRGAEDLFVGRIVKKHWEHLKNEIADNPFNVISARKAIRILQDKPERVPGLGIAKVGTAWRGEINVHVSIENETTPWNEVAERIINNGVEDIIRAVNRKRMEEVYDPEI